VDRLASDAYTTDTEVVERGAFYSGIVCYHQDGKHIQDITKAISSIDSDFDILKYYQTKNWTYDALKNVDWVGLEKFLKHLSPIQRCNTIQMMHNWQNTGSQKQKFHNSSNAKHTHDTTHNDVNTRLGRCPLGCGREESPFHYMKCTTDTMSEVRNKGIDDLTKGLKKLKTAPSLMEAIIMGIKCWSDDVEYDLDEDSHQLLYDESHTYLLRTQSSIGWEQFLKGYLAKAWGNIQGSYYKHIKANSMKFTRARWVHKTLTLLHDYRMAHWTMRNSSLHGGFTTLSKKALRERLTREIRDLYRQDRSLLPLADKDIFKLPLQYRLKQGNQHLMLWAKRARLAFDTIKDIPVDSVVQTSITSWLSSWTGDDIDDTDPISDIVSWQEHEIDRDKEHRNCYSKSDLTSKSKLNQHKGAETILSTE
jgi:hypothetical protein